MGGQSFSAIVGPNGSGKSNTIDALLFVFGYRATKMRQGKLSELIHNSGTIDPEPFGDENTPLGEQEAPAAAAGEDDEDEEDDEGWDEGSAKKGKKGKKGGAKGKGKGKASAKKSEKEKEDERYLIQSCTVEVWFREIIDLVSLWVFLLDVGD